MEINQLNTTLGLVNVNYSRVGYLTIRQDNATIELAPIHVQELFQILNLIFTQQEPEL